jgi:hypothetical protein
MRIESKFLPNIISVVGFLSCVIGWMGYFFIAPVTLFCGILLIRYKKIVTGILCIVLGILFLLTLFGVNISW